MIEFCGVKKLKKVILLSAVLVFCFNLSGCNKKSSDIEETNSENIVLEDESFPEPDSADTDDDYLEWAQIETTSNGYELTVLPDTLPRVVKTDDGSKLNYRSNPVDGDIIGQFLDGTMVQIVKITNMTFTVDGLNDAWYYVADDSFHEGWVFGGYLSVVDSVVSFANNSGSHSTLKLLTGFWENETIVLEILDSDNSFTLGIKESEGFSGKWKLLDDDTLYVYDCYTYDEDPWTVEYKITVCTEDELVLVRKKDNYTQELQRADHPFFNLDEY